MKEKKLWYYAVHKGYTPGVYRSWLECKEQIDGFGGAIFQKFSTEDDAQHFIDNGKVPNKNNILDYLGDKRKLKPPSGKVITIYTDGDLIRVGSNVYAGYGVWFGEGDKRNLSKPLDEEEATNNRAELTAVIEGIKKVARDVNQGCELNIYTDSQYVVQLATSTGAKYKIKKYKKKNGDPVPNGDLVKKLMNAIDGRHINFFKVAAHTGGQDEHSVGNRHADKLAMMGTLDGYIEKTRISIPEQQITFGKHKDLRIGEVPTNYLRWVAKNEDFERRIPLLYRCIVAHLDGKS